MLKKWIAQRRRDEIWNKLRLRKHIMFCNAIANPDPNKVEPSRTNAVNAWLRIERWYEKKCS